MGRIKRVVIIVFDGLGCGELPDAADYGDKGSNTLVNLSKAAGGLDIENLSSFGLGLIEGVDHIRKTASPIASYGRMREVSPGKDTATGHWEMCGVTLEKPFPTYPNGFPPEMMERFVQETGYGWLGGKPASGTGILDELGEEHLRTGRLIVYTSADSVFQIAAHEELVPIEELYRVCRKTRELMDEYGISRVIARPFLGRPGSFKRTTRRKDWPVEPPGELVIERIKKKGLPVVGVGKVGDIFVHRGLTEEIRTVSDTDGMDRTIEALRHYNEGVVFTNLVDFDTLYGHRNDTAGYAKALSTIDKRIPELTALFDEGDMLVLTADHGCDPTTPSTDHSREHVPLLVYGKGLKKGVNLGTRGSFADLGATLAEVFGAGGGASKGRSFLKDVI
ncbi:MAG: phosphopentomutase [Deltaproteobacteria bacterium]|nr:phosphopentomutase [Deltaproteobacteria bacterium]